MFFKMFKGIQKNQVVLKRLQIAGRIQEITLEVREACEEISMLKAAPWWDFREMNRRMKLRRFVREMNAQLMTYRAELRNMYNNQNNNKWQQN